MSDADLGVICKSCGSEVSPYITECPYCGNRLRKRAPKLDRPSEPPPRRRREPRTRRARDRPRLGPLRRGEMPGIRLDVRPYATIVLVAASAALSMSVRAGAVGLDQVAAVPRLGEEWWRLLAAPLAYANSGYLVCALASAALFGWLLERRHGWWAPALVFLVGGAGGMAAASVIGFDLAAVGGNGAALALLGAWAVPDLTERRAGGETDSDLIGVAVIAVALLLLPLAAPEASPVAGVAGGLIGLVLGSLFAGLSRER